ncbi:MAG: lipoate-protein ligase A related protein [Planctomycetaceae bacterium]|nr:lipoate-protein ligase A related protein [Planctomycetaceae bacterium]
MKKRTMQLLDLTLESPAANLALDEALLLRAAEPGMAGEVLRLWESTVPAIILGRSSRCDQEVDLSACQQRGIPVLRRCSGGASVVIGPGCLMYSLIVHYERQPQLRSITTAHDYVLDPLRRALSSLIPMVQRDGTSDLTLNGYKFSGNSLKCTSQSVLYHGTLLYDFPLSWISDLLLPAPRQPAYRESRDHANFVTNFPASRETLRHVLKNAWSADHELGDWPREITRRLQRDRYSCHNWNHRH